jgi:hypothetical protein
LLVRLPASCRPPANHPNFISFDTLKHIPNRRAYLLVFQSLEQSLSKSTRGSIPSHRARRPTPLLSSLFPQKRTKKSALLTPFFSSVRFHPPTRGGGFTLARTKDHSFRSPFARAICGDFLWVFPLSLPDDSHLYCHPLQKWNRCRLYPNLPLPIFIQSRRPGSGFQGLYLQTLR